MTARTLSKLIASHQAAQNEVHVAAMHAVMHTVAKCSTSPLSQDQLRLLKPSASAFGPGVLMEPGKPPKSPHSGTTRMAKCCSPSAARVSRLARSNGKTRIFRPDNMIYSALPTSSHTPSFAAAAAAAELVSSQGYGSDSVGAMALAASAAAAAAAAAASSCVPDDRDRRPSAGSDIRALPSFAPLPASFSTASAGWPGGTGLEEWLRDCEDGREDRPRSSRGKCATESLLASPKSYAPVPISDSPSNAPVHSCRMARSSTAPALPGFMQGGLESEGGAASSSRPLSRAMRVTDTPTRGFTPSYGKDLHPYPAPRDFTPHTAPREPMGGLGSRSSRDPAPRDPAPGGEAFLGGGIPYLGDPTPFLEEGYPTRFLEEGHSPPCCHASHAMPSQSSCRSRRSAPATPKVPAGVRLDEAMRGGPATNSWLPCGGGAATSSSAWVGARPGQRIASICAGEKLKGRRPLSSNNQRTLPTEKTILIWGGEGVLTGGEERTVWQEGSGGVSRGGAGSEAGGSAGVASCQGSCQSLKRQERRSGRCTRGKSGRCTRGT